MIASKDFRHQEHAQKDRNSKLEQKEIFIVNNMNNFCNKEAFFKQQRENITNGKPSSINNQIHEISKMQIDSECNNAIKKLNETKKISINNNIKQNKNFKISEKLSNNDEMEILTEDIEKQQKESPKNIKNNKIKNNKNKNEKGSSIDSQKEAEVEKRKTRKDKLNEILITNYGPEIYEFSMELEKLSFCPNNLKKHKIEPEIRTKMIDWMIEVLSAYNSDPQTFSLSVQLLDMYIARTSNVLTNNDIHLLGVCCMYIASKMEDIVPLRMNHVKSKISHNKFSEKEIKKKEKVILETINFETITSSTYDFIRTFIFDFIHNNRMQIFKLDMLHHIDVFDNVAIFLSKLIFHNEEFSNYKYPRIFLIIF